MKSLSEYKKDIKNYSCEYISESKENNRPISSILGMVLLHQLFEALHKIDKMLD